MVPWIFYAFHRKKWHVFAFSFTFLVLSKENYALWSIFLLPTLWFLYRQEMGAARWKALWIAGIGVIVYLNIWDCKPLLISQKRALYFPH